MNSVNPYIILELFKNKKSKKVLKFPAETESFTEDYSITIGKGPTNKIII